MKMNESISLIVQKKHIEDFPNPQNFIPGYTKLQPRNEIKRASSFSMAHLRRLSSKEPDIRTTPTKQISGKSGIISLSLPILSLASPSTTESQLLPLICPEENDEKEPNDKNERSRNVVHRSQSCPTRRATVRRESILLPGKIVKKEFPSQYKRVNNLQQIHNKPVIITEL